MYRKGIKVNMYTKFDDSRMKAIVAKIEPKERLRKAVAINGLLMAIFPKIVEQKCGYPGIMALKGTQYELAKGSVQRMMGDKAGKGTIDDAASLLWTWGPRVVGQESKLYKSPSAMKLVITWCPYRSQINRVYPTFCSEVYTGYDTGFGFTVNPQIGLLWNHELRHHENRCEGEYMLRGATDAKNYKEWSDPELLKKIEQMPMEERISRSIANDAKVMAVMAKATEKMCGIETLKAIKESLAESASQITPPMARIIGAKVGNGGPEDIAKVLAYSWGISGATYAIHTSPMAAKLVCTSYPYGRMYQKHYADFYSKVFIGLDEGMARAINPNFKVVGKKFARVGEDALEIEYILKA